MLGRKERDQLELFITGSLRQLVPDEYILARVSIAVTMDGRGSTPKWRSGSCSRASCSASSMIGD
jgi:hypothetical protein